MDYPVFNPTKIEHVFINNYLLFCDALPTFFSPHRPSSGGPFTEEYIYNTVFPGP
jgi:hypothetical protein